MDHKNHLGASSDHVQFRIEINPMTTDSNGMGWGAPIHHGLSSHFDMVKLSHGIFCDVDLAGKVSPWMPSQKKKHIAWSCFFPGNSPLFFLVSIPFLLVKSPDCLCVFCTLFNLMRKVFQNTNHGHRVNNFWWITRGMVKPVAWFRSPGTSDLQRSWAPLLWSFGTAFFLVAAETQFLSEDTVMESSRNPPGRRTGCSMRDADSVKWDPGP